MGLQDRPYYQDSYTNPWSGGSLGQGTRSVIINFIMINVGIFVADMFFPAIHSFLALKPVQQPWAFWELLTYGFAHAPFDSKESIFHVGGNMLVLFFLGSPIEQRLGRNEFLKFYLVAILVSGLGFLLLNLGSSKAMLGASGAVSAVVALFVFCFPNQNLMMFGVFPIRAWIFGVVVVVMDLFRSMNPESPIAWEAHLTGFAFGAAYFYWNWDLGWLKIEKLSQLFKSRPDLKIHRPSKTDKIREQGEQILEKINQEGEESLNSRERKILKQYSEQLRNERG